MKNGFKIPRPYRTATVSAGQSGVVWEEKIPGGCIAFIDHIASNFYSSTYFIFEIDEENVETGHITRQLGDLRSPRKFDPQLLAKYHIKITAYNNTSEDLTFEILLDGTIYEDQHGTENNQ